MFKSQDVRKCKPPEKVPMVKVGQYELETMLEQYQSFMSGNKICFQLFLVFLKNCICVIIAVQITGLAQM